MFLAVETLEQKKRENQRINQKKKPFLSLRCLSFLFEK